MKIGWWGGNNILPHTDTELAQSNTGLIVRLYTSSFKDDDSAQSTQRIAIMPPSSHSSLDIRRQNKTKYVEHKLKIKKDLQKSI